MTIESATREASLGTRLRQARIERGLSLADIAGRTNIRVEYLRLIERGDGSELPDPAYATAFARSYALVLDLDLEPGALADEFVRAGPAVDPHPGGRTPPLAAGEGEPAAPTAPGGEPGKPLPRLATALLIAAIALVTVLLLTAGDERNEPPADSERVREGVERHGRGSAGAAGADLRTPEELSQRATTPEPPARESGRQQPAQPEPGSTLRVASPSGVAVCVLADGEPTALHGALGAGSTQAFRGSQFDLIFPEGFDPEDLRALLDGERVAIPDTQGPAAVRIGSTGESETIAFQGGCQ